nr:MAG TPA: hypothetical protein [Caudoviricetes sp.]
MGSLLADVQDMSKNVQDILCTRARVNVLSKTAFC